jgi:hypothetical protein
MDRSRFVSGVALLLAVSLILTIQQPLNGQVSVSVQPETLAQAFVKAINDKSVDGRMKILHPKTVACVNSQTQPFFDWIFSRQFKYVIPASYKIKMQPSTGTAFSPAEVKFDFPVSPTHILQIDYSTRPFSSTTIVLSIVEEGGRWYEVLPCPQPEAVSMAKASEAKSKELEARTKRLAAELRDPLRAEIISLARDGHRIDAVKRYAAASGEDLVVADSVVDLLVPDK